jgi:hypothetical protein
MALGIRHVKEERQPWGKRVWRKLVSRKARRARDKLETRRANDR